MPVLIDSFTTILSLTQTNYYLFRKYFYSDKLLRRYLDGNLRNIKRIFNVLSLTLWVIHYQDKEVNINSIYTVSFFQARGGIIF